MTRTTRARALALLAAAPLAACNRGSGSDAGVRVGSKNFTEEVLLGNLYVLRLRAAGIPATPKLDLGATQIAMAALQRGDIDLYPEYTGTALLTVLNLPAQNDANAIYETVKREYQQRYKLTWLPPAPFNDSQALGTTTERARALGVTTLSGLAPLAANLTLGIAPEFVKRADGLPGLQRVYGGFRFKAVKQLEIGLSYKALDSGAVDIIAPFTTDAQLATAKYTLFRDDKHLWPPYQVAPVVRDDVLTRVPHLADALAPLQALLTDDVMRGLNAQVALEKKEPADVAAAFLKQHQLG